MPRHCYVLRVFTRGEEGGNHLGVVTDRSGLPPAKMQEIAAELGFSETVFMDWRGAIPKVRIFTPTSEMPFAGHPLVGLTWVLLALGPGGPGQVECGVGMVDIGLDDGTPWIKAPLGQPVRRDEVLEGYDPGSVPVAVDVVEMPLRYQMVELADEAAVAAALLPTDGKIAVFAQSGDHVKLRFFAPDVGVPEDPATGSAAVALAALMRARGEDSGRATISQGDEVGFPSTIDLRWDSETATIGGSVVRDEIRWLEH